MAGEHRDCPRTGTVTKIVTRSPVVPVLPVCCLILVQKHEARLDAPNLAVDQSVAACAGPERLRFAGASGSPQRESEHGENTKDSMNIERYQTE